MRRVIAVLVLSMFLPGCLSVNLQLAGLRSSGDISVVVGLDATGAESLAERKAQVKGIAEQMLDFLESGEVAALTQGELKTALYQLVPERFRSYADLALGQVATRHLELGLIGAVNVERIRAVLLGVVNGCEKYLDKYHAE